MRHRVVLTLTSLVCLAFVINSCSQAADDSPSNTPALSSHSPASPAPTATAKSPQLRPLTLSRRGLLSYELDLDTAEPVVVSVVQDLGHEPNGYFWDAVAEWLIQTQMPSLEGHFTFNSEAGLFSASAPDRAGLERLAARMAEVANNPDQVRKLIETAESAGFVFDD